MRAYQWNEGEEWIELSLLIDGMRVQGSVVIDEMMACCACACACSKCALLERRARDFEHPLLIDGTMARAD